MKRINSDGTHKFEDSYINPNVLRSFVGDPAPIRKKSPVFRFFRWLRWWR